MTDSLFDYYLPALAGFIIAYYILSSGGTVMEAIFYTLLTVALTLLGGTLLKVYLEPNLIRRRERKELRREKLIDKILKPLQCLVIKHKDFKVWIEGLDKLKKLEEFDFAFQHLRHKKYLDILTSWKKSNELIDGTEGVNKRLEDLKKYIDGKIIKKYRDDLAHQIWDIVQLAFYEDTKVDYIKIGKVKDGMMDIPRNEKDGIKIHCVLGENKTKEILSKIFKREFRNHLNGIQGVYNKLDEEFKEKFQKSLEKLIDSINNKKEDLKGRCEDCSYLVKWFGDC